MNYFFSNVSAPYLLINLDQIESVGVVGHPTRFGLFDVVVVFLSGRKVNLIEMVEWDTALETMTLLQENM